MPPVKVIFGLRTSTTTKVTVTPAQSPGSPAPTMTVAEQEVDEVNVAFESGAWVHELAAGDFILYVMLPIGDWFDGTVSITTDEEAQFIIHRDDPTHENLGWTADEAVVGDGEDPKDPWPPPAQLDTLTGDGWFEETLHDLAATIDNPRSAPPPDE